jgi:hypothetical protein
MEPDSGKPRPCSRSARELKASDTISTGLVRSQLMRAFDEGRGFLRRYSDSGRKCDTGFVMVYCQNLQAAGRRQRVLGIHNPIISTSPVDCSNVIF